MEKPRGRAPGGEVAIPACEALRRLDDRNDLIVYVDGIRLAGVVLHLWTVRGRS